MKIELVLCAALVVALDRLTKALVARRLPEGQSVRVGPWLRIRHVASRRGSPWSLRSPLALLCLGGAAQGVLLFVTQQGYFFQQRTAQLGLGAALGGAASNLYDRLRSGAVTDFLDVGWWPVFNMADIAISMGALAALWSMR